MAITPSWGKPRIFAQKVGTTEIIEFPTPVEGSTTLETTEGEKTEAKIEGGENEAVKYAKSTYALKYQIRLAADRMKAIADADGIIDGLWTIILQPQDTTALGICIDRSTIKAMDSFTAADGALVDYTADALSAPTGNQIKWGTVKVTESSGNITKVEFTEHGSSSATTTIKTTA